MFIKQEEEWLPFKENCTSNHLKFHVIFKKDREKGWLLADVECCQLNLNIVCGHIYFAFSFLAYAA